MSGSGRSGIPAWQRIQTPLQSEKDPKTEEDQSTTRTSSEEPPVDATESPLQEETGIAPNLFSTNSNNRQTILASVRKFLEDPAVKDAPYDKKRTFLESKGISSDVMDEILGKGPATEKQEFNVEDFKSKSRSQVTAQQQGARDVAPIVTYPEFLIQPQKPPPLVTVSRLVNTAYIAGGAAAVVYGLSKYIIGPMTENLTEARHDFAQHTQSHIDQLNGKLSTIVSKVPAPVKPKVTENDTTEDDVESVASDPTELFHRDIGVQTSPRVSRRPSLSSSDSSSPDSAPAKTTLDKQEDRLKILSSHLGELLRTTDDAGANNERIQDRLDELRKYVDSIAYQPPLYDGSYSAGITSEKKTDDAITGLRNEIRGVKGVLLSARRFPAASVPATARVGG